MSQACPSAYYGLEDALQKSTNMNDGPAVPHQPGQFVIANGIEIFCDSFGEPDWPPILLIMGLGGQMTAWDEGFCRQLASGGLRVIRYDHRDTGLSKKFDAAALPDVAALLAAAVQQDHLEIPYSLMDMARDAAGVLDALDIPAAHMVGFSMGGMIAQILAIHLPDRVRSLTSIMSSTGDPGLPPPEPEAISLFLRPPATNRDGYIARTIEGWKVLRGPLFPFDEVWAREKVGLLYDRSYYPDGGARHLAAAIAAGSRKEALKSVSVPALVVHGDADPLVPLAAGKETADAIPGARLIVIPGLGHELPPAVWPALVAAIHAHAGARLAGTTAID